MGYVGPNGIWFTRDPARPPPPSFASSASSVLEALSAGEMSIQSVESIVRIGGQGNSNVLVIGSNLVSVYGDLRVTGSVDSVYTNDLRIVDQLIVAASGAASNDASRGLTSGAGILVGDPKTDGSGGWERSVRWRAGISDRHDVTAGYHDAGGASNSGSWDVRGGSLRVTSVEPTGREVSYGIRASRDRDDAMEVFKRVLPASGAGEMEATYRVVMRAGSSRASGGEAGIRLPMSDVPLGY
jgi:hypothetical protein